MRWRIFALVAFLCLAACGDDDSDFTTRPDGKESSSSVTPKSSDGKTKNDGREEDDRNPLDAQERDARRNRGNGEVLAQRRIRSGPRQACCRDGLVFGNLDSQDVVEFLQE